ncbi:alpha beta-hydrolase superfamily isoform B [Micractinium conductrix]|uniref:Alpha beta-hydrolase superfamily isoform A n=1 Tax=Micractinium conductrix TaxID=554055 RepID=A0A2P6VPJ4_9CHLO|nr:alpha beta-hydrolase superfamily isoform A [Micractinium conductrix]PSC76000.1 alpha beta-hydrolase superfamily isoform B [Micractinium conductrix]|eukprot:PSC75999.1 alpha beta-hydrolase superfamily isoform A [Micractinium conductrix]
MVDWVKLGVKTLGALGGVVGLALGLLYFLQEKIIYVPRLPGIPAEYPYLPDAFRLAYEDAWLTTADGLRLHAWMVWPPHWGEAERRSRPTVLFFQENAGNMAYRLHFLQALTRFLECNAFIFSYRGYGASEGSPSEKGLQLDAQAALDHVLLRTDIDATQVVLFGRSLGGAVAAYAAARRPRHISGLVLENTFTRIVDVVPKTMPLLSPFVGPGRPFNFLVRNHWDTRPRLQQLKDLPVLFMSSLQDEMLPPEHMRELYQLHPQDPWTIVYFEDGRHLDAYDALAAQYWPVLQGFMSTLGPAQPLPPLPEPAAAAAEDASEQQQQRRRQPAAQLRPPEELEMAASGGAAAAEGAAAVDE